MCTRRWAPNFALPLFRSHAHRAALAIRHHFGLLCSCVTQQTSPSPHQSGFFLFLPWLQTYSLRCYRNPSQNLFEFICAFDARGDAMSLGSIGRASMAIHQRRTNRRWHCDLRVVIFLFLYSMYGSHHFSGLSSELSMQVTRCTQFVIWAHFLFGHVKAYGVFFALNETNFLMTQNWNSFPFWSYC